LAWKEKRRVVEEANKLYAAQLRTQKARFMAA
jgi:hypothetical protein